MKSTNIQPSFFSPYFPTLIENDPPVLAAPASAHLFDSGYLRESVADLLHRHAQGGFELRGCYLAG